MIIFAIFILVVERVSAHKSNQNKMQEQLKMLKVFAKLSDVITIEELRTILHAQVANACDSHDSIKDLMVSIASINATSYEEFWGKMEEL